MDVKGLLRLQKEGFELAKTHYLVHGLISIYNLELSSLLLAKTPNMTIYQKG